jgi:hypothetical protein
VKVRVPTFHAVALEFYPELLLPLVIGGHVLWLADEPVYDNIEPVVFTCN